MLANISLEDQHSRSVVSNSSKTTQHQHVYTVLPVPVIVFILSLILVVNFFGKYANQISFLQSLLFVGKYAKQISFHHSLLLRGKSKKALTDLNWYQHTLDVGFRRRQHCRNVFHLSTPLRYEMIIWFISCWSCFEMYHSNWASSSKVRVFDKQLHNSVIFQLVLYYSTRELHWRFFH